MNRSTSGPTPEAERAPRRARAGLVALGVLVASAVTPVALSAMAAAAPAPFAADQVALADPTGESPAQPEVLVGFTKGAPCTADGGAHCLAIVNNSDSRIQSWELRVLNPETNLFDHVRCLAVPGDNGSGTTFFPDIHLNKGQRFLLESRRDRKDCGGDMWAGQGFTLGVSDGANYSFAGFTASNPDRP